VCLSGRQVTRIFSSILQATLALGRERSARLFSPPVVPTVDSANGLVITYRDTDGSGTRATIIATLRRKSILTGAVINIAAINTDTGPVVTGYSTLVTALSPSGGYNLFTFEFTNFVYYVQINIRRSSTAQQPLVGAVVLSSGCLQ
jgi:hypothetical protein